MAVVSTAAKGGTAAPLTVAVGTHGLIMTSSDSGTTWTKRTSGVTTDLNDVTWGTVGTAPIYVAVGMNSTVLTSTDGITWTAKNTPHVATAVPDNLMAVALVGTRVVTVGGNATSGLVFSWDGLATTTWVKGSAGVPEYVTGVTALGSTVVAITKSNVLGGSIGTTLALTKKVPTGLSLTADSPFSVSLTGLNSSSKIWLCTKTIAGGPCKIWFSNDGIAWAPQTLAGIASSSLNLRASNQQAIATGPAGDVWTSDGTTWTQRSAAGSQLLYSGASSGSTYITVGEGGRIFTQTSPATTWTSTGSTGSIASLEGIASNGTAFVGVGNGFTLTSASGTGWTEVAQVGKDMRSALYSGSQYVIVGKGAWTAPDGNTLTETFTAGVTEELNRVTKAGSQLIAVGSDGPHSLVYSSASGAAWTKSSTVPATAIAALRGVAATTTGGLIVAIGDTATILTSADYGVTWTKQALPKGFPATENFTDVAFANNLFIAVTNKGGIWTSPSGATWTSRRTTSSAGFNRIMVAGNQIIAFGDSGLYAWSFGGTIWTTGDIGTSQNITDAAFNGTTLVAVGETGAVFNSSGGQPGRPTVSFAVASATVKEDVGTTNITLNLSPAAPTPVTVLFTVSGTATSSADYTLATTPITFAAGDTTKLIPVVIKKDTIDEEDEVLTLSLGAPTGEAILGTPKAHTLTITDLFPTFTVHPTSQLVVAGTSPVLNATVSGSTMIGTWKKNGGTAAGLTTSPTGASLAAITTVPYTGTLTNVQPAQAGAYTLSVASPSGTKVSNIGQLGVVVNNPAAVGAAVDSTVILTAVAAGNGLTYQWLHDGVELHNSSDLRITGTNTLKLTMKSVDPSDSGVYACRVTMTTPTGPLTHNACTTTVAVATSVPLVLTTGALPPTTVGQPYSFSLSANDVVSGWDVVENPTPTGLTFNKITGQISGQASASGSFSITIAAKNAIGTSPPQIVTLQVAALPTNSVGTFDALIDRSPAVNQNLGGYLRISTAAGGTLTGNLTQGAVTTSFSGPMTYVPGSPATLTASVPISPVTPTSPVGTPPWPILPAVTLSLTITPSTNTITGSITAGSTSLPFTGLAENRWVSSPVPVDKRGLYNFIIQPPSIPPSQALTNVKNPQGFGFGAFTVQTNGTVIVAGQTADGSSYTRSGAMAADETIMFYNGNFGTLSSIHGSLALEVSSGLVFTDTDNASATTKEVRISGNLTWLRGAEPTPSSASQITTEFARERFYRDGFQDGAGNVVPLTYTADGGHFFKQPSVRPAAPSSTGVLMNLPSSSNNARVSFLFGSLADTTTRVTDNNPDSVFTIGAPAVTSGIVNANLLSFVTSAADIDASNKGQFRGSFSIKDPHPFLSAQTVTRSTAFRGLIIRQANVAFTTVTQRGYGYFLLPKLPEAGAGPNGTNTDTATNSPILSGQVKLTP